MTDEEHAVELHLITITKTGPYAQASCQSCQWLGKRRRDRYKATQDGIDHRKEAGKYDFGFGKTNRTLETALRNVARSGYTFQQVQDALRTPWPHLLGVHDYGVYDIRGMGPVSVNALMIHFGIKP